MSFSFQAMMDDFLDLVFTELIFMSDLIVIILLSLLILSTVFFAYYLIRDVLRG